jgi:hypothetical protein
MSDVNVRAGGTLVCGLLVVAGILHFCGDRPNNAEVDCGDLFCNFGSSTDATVQNCAVHGTTRCGVLLAEMLLGRDASG